MESINKNIKSSEIDTKDMNYNMIKCNCVDPNLTYANDISCICLQNLSNIRVSTICGFFFLAAASIPQPITNNYLKAMDIDPENAGVMMSITSLTSLIGAFVINYYLSKNFKLTFIVCNVIAASNFILYGLSGHFKSFMIMFLGRCIYGFGNSKVAARRYILGYSPETHIKRFSLELTALMAIGSATGPLLDALIFWLFPGDKISSNPLEPNKYSLAGYTAAVLMLSHAIGIYFYFRMAETKQEVLIEEENREEEFEVDFFSAGILSFMFFLVECGIEILFILFSYHNFEVENGYFNEQAVNIIVGISNFMVFVVIYLIRKKSEKLKLVPMTVFFTSCSLVFALIMGPFGFSHMIKFTIGFKLFMIALNMCESKGLIRFA